MASCGERDADEALPCKPAIYKIKGHARDESSRLVSHGQYPAMYVGEAPLEDLLPVGGMVNSASWMAGHKRVPVWRGVVVE